MAAGGLYGAHTYCRIRQGSTLSPPHPVFDGPLIVAHSLTAPPSLLLPLVSSTSPQLPRPIPHFHPRPTLLYPKKLPRTLPQEAAAAGWPLMQCVRLENMATVVDSASFLDLFKSVEHVSEREDLGYAPPEEGIFKDLKDLRLGGAVEGEEVGPSVGQLLTEQIEIADVLVLNKVDTVTDVQVCGVRLSLWHGRWVPLGVAFGGAFGPG